MFLVFRLIRYLHAADQAGNVPWITCVLHFISTVMEAMPKGFPEGPAQTNHGNLAAVLYFVTVCVFGVSINYYKDLKYSTREGRNRHWCMPCPPSYFPPPR